MAPSTASARRLGTVASRSARCGAASTCSGHGGAARCAHGGAPGLREFGGEEIGLFFQHKGVKDGRVLRVGQDIANADPLDAKAEHRAQKVAVARQRLAFGGDAQRGDRLGRPGAGRLQAEHPALRTRPTAPEPPAAALRAVHGRGGQRLLAVRQKAGAARNAAVFRRAAEFFDTAHKEALAVVLRRDETALPPGGVRRRRHCFRVRRSDRP